VVTVRYSVVYFQDSQFTHHENVINTVKPDLAFKFLIGMGVSEGMCGLSG
jgi:hypothetical protein